MARERDYELGIVLAPETPDEQARAIVERITNTVTAQGGVVVRINAWGRRRLAYPIEHHRDGLYYFFDLQLPPTSVVEIERLIGVNEDIIRHLMKARDPRVIGDERKRAEEAEIRAQQEAEARAAAEAEAAARVRRWSLPKRSRLRRSQEARRLSAAGGQQESAPEVARRPRGDHTGDHRRRPPRRLLRTPKMVK